MMIRETIESSEVPNANRQERSATICAVSAVDDSPLEGLQWAR